MWLVINEIINSKKSAKKLKTAIFLVNWLQKFDTNSKHFLYKICEYFATIGATKSIFFLKLIINSFLKIHSKRCITSFVLHKISEEEVGTCINNVKTHSAHGPDDSPKFVKLANKILTPCLQNCLINVYNYKLFHIISKRHMLFHYLKLHIQKTLVTLDQFLYS